jgi:hypothetical protein
MLLLTRLVATYSLGIGGDPCLSLLDSTPVASGGALGALVGSVLSTLRNSLDRTSLSIGTLTATTAVGVDARNVGTVKNWLPDCSIGLG